MVVCESRRIIVVSFAAHSLTHCGPGMLLRSCCFSLTRMGKVELQEAAGNEPQQGHPGRYKQATHRASKIRRGVTDQLAETRAESSQTLVSHGEADFGNRELIARQKTLGLLDPASRQKLVRRLA